MCEPDAVNPTLVVLAAGIGSRYGGIKQLDQVGPGNEILVDYAVYDAVQAGFRKVVFIVNPEIYEQFRAEIAGKYEGYIQVDYALQRLTDLPDGFTVPPERKKPWGTAHALWSARHKVDGPFVVVNADDFYGRSSYERLAQAFRLIRERAASTSVDEYCMCGFHVKNTLSEHGSVSRGICTLTDDGYLADIREITAIEKCGEAGKYVDGNGQTAYLDGNAIASMNMWGFTPSIFDHLRKHFEEFLRERGQEEKSEFLIPDVVRALIREGRAQVSVFISDDQWFGVTYKEDRPRVEEQLKELAAGGVYPSPLF